MPPRQDAADLHHIPPLHAATIKTRTPEGPQSVKAESRKHFSGSSLPVNSVEPNAFPPPSTTQPEQYFPATSGLPIPHGSPLARAPTESFSDLSIRVPATTQPDQYVPASNSLQIPQPRRARGLSDVSVQVSSIGDNNNISPLSGLSSASNSFPCSTPPRSGSPTRPPVLHDFDHQRAAESAFPSSEQGRRFNVGQTIAPWGRGESQMDAADHITDPTTAATQWAGNLPQPETMIDPEQKSYAAHPSKAERRAEVGRPEPYVVEPLSEKHTHTLIWLHGTSSEGHMFGDEVLGFRFPKPIEASIEDTFVENDGSEKSADLTTLQECLPTARFVFPSGSLKQVTVLDRKSNAWFDVHNFSDRTMGEKCPIMRSGMSESIHYLKSLVRKENDILNYKVLRDPSPKSRIVQRAPKNKVILVGFSQGCAVGVITLLSGLLKDPALGAFIGLSGWLPFISDIRKDTVSQFPAHSVPYLNPGLLRRRTVNCINNLLSLIPKCEDVERRELEGQGMERSRIGRLEKERNSRLEELDNKDEGLNNLIRAWRTGNKLITNPEWKDIEAERVNIWRERKKLKKEHENMAVELGKLEQNVLEIRKKAEGAEMRDLELDPDVPIWFAHGLDDQKVKSQWNGDMRRTVGEVGMAQVDGEYYEGLGHEFGKEEFRDMVTWLQDLRKLGFPVVKDKAKQAKK